MGATTVDQVVHELRERIQGVAAGGQRAEGKYVSTGFEALDRILGHGGLRRGSLIEWTGAGEGSGAATLALKVAANVLRHDGTFVVIDKAGEFYPVAAADLGMALERTIVVRPESRHDALWAWEQSLRCPGVAITFGWIDAIDDRVLRRLQLAVETGGGLGFLLRSPNGRSGPSWATTRINVRSAAKRYQREDSLTRWMQVSLSHGETVEVELPHEASDVSLVPELAHSATTGG